jgi:hypothetical protein
VQKYFTVIPNMCTELALPSLLLMAFSLQLNP